MASQPPVSHALHNNLNYLYGLLQSGFQEKEIISVAEQMFAALGSGAISVHTLVKKLKPAEEKTSSNTEGLNCLPCGITL